MGKAFLFSVEKCLDLKLRDLWVIAVSEVLTASIIRAMMIAIIALMMEAVRISETSVRNNETSWRNIPEHSHLHTRRRENLRSHISCTSPWKLVAKK
jgi:hypothetical protein